MWTRTAMLRPLTSNDPMTMLLRENAIQANLMRWDDTRNRYVLTGTGRRQISARPLAPGMVLSFGKRDVVRNRPTRGKSGDSNLKE